MNNRLTLLVESSDAIAIITAWPEVMAAHRDDITSHLDMTSHLSMATGLPTETVSRVMPILRTAGVLLDNGQVDEAVTSYLDRLGLAKLAGLGAFDPALITAKFLAEMSLSDRMDWLVDNHLLE